MRTTQQLAALLTQSTDAIAILDPAGLICDWNPAAETLLGWSRDQMLDDVITGHVPMAALPGLAEAWAALKDGADLAAFACPVEHVEGQLVTVNLQLTAVRDGRSFDGAIAVFVPPPSIAEKRDQAGEERDHAGEERDVVGEERDLAGARRDRAGDQRDDAGMQRDDEGLRRDDIAGARDLSARSRDVTGEARDRRGELRDSDGTQRDLQGEQRDDAASLRDLVAERSETRRLWGRWVDAGRPSAIARRFAAEDRREASRDRGAGASDRSASGRDRTTASDDRQAGAAQRTEAGEDRAVASTDRGAGAADRALSRIDRRTSQADRGAGASERSESEVDRDSALADRGASAREREHASLDELTGAYRREAGFVELEREITRARRAGRQLVVAFVDLDGLKRVNDSRGHAAGDLLLLRVVDALRLELRGHDLVIRYGGDEFVCVIPDLLADEAGERFARVNEALAVGPHPGSISVGLAELRAGDEPADVIARADAALYARRQDKRRA